VDFDWNIREITRIAPKRKPVLPVLPIILFFKYLSHSTIASNEEKMRLAVEAAVLLC
jgi:hypothetical protein